MNVVLMIGDALRHRSIALRVQQAGHLAALVVETREPFVPEPPEGLSDGLARTVLGALQGP